MNTISTDDIIEVITPTEPFRAVVEHASNGGLAGMIIRNAGGPHILFSRQIWDSNAEGRWILDHGEGGDVQLQLMERR